MINKYFKVEFTIKGKVEIKEINVRAKSENDIKNILISEGAICEIISIDILKIKPKDYIG